MTVANGVLESKAPKRKYSFGGTKLMFNAHREVFTTGQIARICKVAPRTVSKWFDAGRLKGYRIPGSLDRRVPKAELIRFMKENDIPLGDLEAVNKPKVMMAGQTAVETELLVKAFEDLGTPSQGFGSDWFGLGLEFASGLPDCLVLDTSNGRDFAVSQIGRMRTMENQGGVARVSKSPMVNGAVVVVLAGEDETDPKHFVRNGADIVFCRPYAPDQVAKTVVEAILNRAKRWSR